MHKTLNYILCVIFFVFISACGNSEEQYVEFWAAASMGELQKVEQLVDSGIDVNRRDLSGGSALLQAAMEGHTDVVNYLISKKAEINIREKSLGLSPLSAAASNGHKSTVAVLLEAGATDIDGALAMAVQYRRDEIAQMLRDAKK